MDCRDRGALRAPLPRSPRALTDTGFGTRGRHGVACLDRAAAGSAAASAVRLVVVESRTMLRGLARADGFAPTGAGNDLVRRIRAEPLVKSCKVEHALHGFPDGGVNE